MGSYGGGICLNKDSVFKIAGILRDQIEVWSINDVQMRVEKKFRDGYVNLNSKEMLHKSLLVERMLTPHVLSEISDDATYAFELLVALGKKYHCIIGTKSDKSSISKSLNVYSFFDSQIREYHSDAESFFCSVTVLYFVTCKLGNKNLFRELLKEIKNKSPDTPLINYSYSYFLKAVHEEGVFSNKDSSASFFNKTTEQLHSLNCEFEKNLIENYEHFHAVSGEGLYLN